MKDLNPRSAPDTLCIPDYIAFQASAGIFSESTPAPECDPRVLRAYHGYERKEYPEDGVSPVRMYLGKYGFYRDWIDEERVGLNWAMSTPLVDLQTGYAFEEFRADLPALRDAVLADAADRVLTDTFAFTDGFGDLAPGHDAGIVLMQSPVADLTLPFDPYLDSLTSERRKKYRRMLADFQKTPLRFEMSGEGLGAKEIDFIRANLAVKWGSEAGYAFRQTLWSLAVQDVRPEQNLVMRVYDADRLVFIQTMIVKGNTVYCQSITKDEESFYSGLAAFTDFKCVEALCGRGYKTFDPSCRTGLDDPESIGIAKRATVNRNQVKPILAIGKEFPPEIEAMVRDASCQGKEA